MSVIQAIKTGAAQRRTIIDVTRELGPTIAQRASEATDEDQFVAENFALLKASGLLEAGVPVELGGGGADVDELAAVLQMLGYHCARAPEMPRKWMEDIASMRAKYSRRGLPPAIF